MSDVPAPSRQNWHEVSESKRDTFLARLEECGQVSKSAKLSSVDPATLYRERKNNPEFAKQWEEAIALSRTARFYNAEDALYKRGVDGWLEPVYYQGKKVGTVRKFDGRLLIALLEAEAPKKYRSNVKAEDIRADVRESVGELMNALMEESEDIPQDASEE